MGSVNVGAKIRYPFPAAGAYVLVSPFHRREESAYQQVSFPCKRCFNKNSPKCPTKDDNAAFVEEFKRAQCVAVCKRVIRDTLNGAAPAFATEVVMAAVRALERKGGMQAPEADDASAEETATGDDECGAEVGETGADMESDEDCCGTVGMFF